MTYALTFKRNITKISTANIEKYEVLCYIKGREIISLQKKYSKLKNHELEKRIIQMNRKILLVEPNYKNKYPPIGLMKLATYYRMMGDDVRFYKGDIKLLAVELIYEDLLEQLYQEEPNVFWQKYYPELRNFIRTGKYSTLNDHEILTKGSTLKILSQYRKKYREKDYFSNPKFDKVGITTLFTFYWEVTIDTINFAKKLCKNQEDVMVGGIMSSLLPDEVYEATGIYPFVGLLNRPGQIDQDNDIIIDELPLDYSILEEIDYVYPANDAYFAYMTRGCVNKCKFCAVPLLEPKFCDYINLKEKIQYTKEMFGERRNLLLLDNNVLASKQYDQIIDEIKECGFGTGAKYLPPNEYEIAIKNLKKGYNDRAYIRKMVAIYQETLNKLKDQEERQQLEKTLEKSHCLHHYTAAKEKILELEDYIRPLYDKTHKFQLRKRIVDFNQGIDSRFITEKNMAKLSEVNIYPLRIAFDHYKLKDIYERSVRAAAKSGIKNLSNYLLYNFDDKPEELYHRLRLNVDLCEELGANIYSFPMKYHPINDKEYFMNRDYIGKHWNRKFIRAIQSILNSTKGKVGKGMELFDESFGKNVDEFMRILWMPETFIIYRRTYDARLREKLATQYEQHSSDDCDLANEWWKDFLALSEEQRTIAQSIIAKNKFKNVDYGCIDPAILKVLSYYEITRRG